MLLFGDDCHWIVPAFPLKVRVELLVPEHTVVLPATVPPAEGGKMVTATGARVAEGHVTLFGVQDNWICPFPLLAFTVVELFVTPPR